MRYDSAFIDGQWRPVAGTDTLREAGIDPAGTATSSFRITWMIPREKTDDAVRLLHRRFIEAQAPPVP